MSSTIVPQPTPTLETLWQKARAGLIPWSVVQEYQSSLMPRCTNHPDRSAPVYWDELALCVDCFAAVGLTVEHD